MAGETKITTNHDEIRRWAEERDGKPAVVQGTEDGTGILRIDFPGFEGEEKLISISWDEFFKKFEDNNLAFLYQEETAEGEKSRFNKLVSREE